MMALKYAPGIIAIALVIGVFAFGLSTADSQLVVASSILEHDMLPQKKENEGKSISKRMTPWLAVMMVIILIIVKFRPVFLVTYAYGFCAPGFAQMMPAMFGGLYWKRATKEGAIAGTLGGCIAVLVTLFIKNPVPLVQPILWGLLINLILYIAVSMATQPSDIAAKEIHEPLEKFFAPRNNSAHKVLVVLIALIFVQLIVISPYLPGTILFGWCPAPVFNWICGAIELCVVGYFFGKNRLYDPDGSKKDF